MKKLLAIGMLALGIAAYAGEQKVEQGERLSRVTQYRLFEDYGNREADF